MATVEETGNEQRHTVSDQPISGQLPPDLHWAGADGHPVRSDAPPPTAQELAGSELGVAAQAGRDKINAKVAELADFTKLWERS